MPPSWYEAKRKAPESPSYLNNSLDSKNGSAATQNQGSTFSRMYGTMGNGVSRDTTTLPSTHKRPRISGESAPHTSVADSLSSFNNQSKLKRPSSSASPRLSSLSEKFAFKPSAASLSSTVFSRYNSMLGAPTSPSKSGARMSHSTSGATAGLDSREEIIAKRLQNVFRTVPAKMINYAVKKKGTFDSAADWLEGQDMIVSKNSRNSSTSSSSRSSPSIAAAMNKAKGNSYQDLIGSDSELEELELVDEDDDLISEAANSGFLEAKREVSKPALSIRQKYSHRSDQPPPTDDIEEIVLAPKRRLVRAQPVEEEKFMSDESDNAETYDDVEEVEFEGRVLDFMNTASVENIADMAACELSMAQVMCDARPFSSLDMARQVSSESEGKSNRKKSIGDKIIDAAYAVSTLCAFKVYL